MMASNGGASNGIAFTSLPDSASHKRTVKSPADEQPRDRDARTEIDGDGDVLVFLPGEREIRDVAELAAFAGGAAQPKRRIGVVE